MKKLIIPLILIIHCICNLIYYKYGSAAFGWGVFFHTNWAIFVASICLVCSLKKIDRNDQTFLMMGFASSFIMGTVFIANYFGLIEYTYGFTISISSLLLTLLLLVTSL